MPGVPASLTTATVAAAGHRGRDPVRGAPPRCDRAATAGGRRGPPAGMPERREQGPGAAGVLAADQVGLGQDVARPGREVAEVPDRRGHEDEPAAPLAAHGPSLTAPLGTSRTSSWSPTRTPQRSSAPASVSTTLRAARPPSGHPPRLEPGHAHHGQVGREEGHVDGELHARACARSGRPRRAARPRTPSGPAGCRRSAGESAISSAHTTSPSRSSHPDRMRPRLPDALRHSV